MGLTDLFDASLLGRANQAGLECLDNAGNHTALTFGAVEVRSNRLAHLLIRRGLTAGDRLAVYLPNRPEFIDLFLACVKTGVILVPMNVLYREREIRHILGDAEPKAVVTSALLAPELPSGTDVWVVEAIRRELDGEPDSRPVGPVAGDAPAAICYTSGTTGTSKGAVLTHDNFLANGTGLVTCWQITSEDRYLAVLPLFHVHGLGNGIHCWLASGCHMRLLERFDHSTAAAQFEDYRPTLFFGVPTIYVRLLDTEPTRAQQIGRRMRLFVSGSAPLPAQVLADFAGLFGHRILERYGMTETLMNISNPYHGERRAGTVGLPLPGISARIVDETGSLVATGETGELHIRGPNVFTGYWKRAEATNLAFVDGFFRTGDLAECTPDGYYTLKGRRSDLIISGGFNIYPRELEELLLDQPGVREAAVVGVHDPVRGEVPVAYLVMDEELDVRILRAVLKKELASFKMPRGFIRVDSLPRTALGKVQKHLLPPWAP